MYAAVSSMGMFGSVLSGWYSAGLQLRLRQQLRSSTRKASSATLANVVVLEAARRPRPAPRVHKDARPVTDRLISGHFARVRTDPDAKSVRAHDA
eukprot:CAMPEP_0180063816 /NCGR_PEP_ID=MMETSP0985-20121206/7844_1 /TAXON_ID=483367 /ORGANISM="non described non described, Strain CCMP 2436" /LENGTH=94 /DNA_ID=CAMNT_0021994065 /DNA_START=378 /DNA_END=659 /DNA_ORIENTATION=-